MNNSNPEYLKAVIGQSPRNARGYRKYPIALRTEVITYAKAQLQDGGNIRSIALELGLSESVLDRWIRNTLKTKTKAPKLRPVRINSPETLVIHGPLGLRIEGPISSIAALVHACSTL